MLGHDSSEFDMLDGFRPEKLIAADEIADEHARCRETVWLSPPQLIEGPVDLEGLDCAGYIHQFADETKIAISGEEAPAFNATWRRMLNGLFSIAHDEGELQEWLDTGRSNGWQLRLQLMCLPPHTWFRVHAHPCIEMILCLSGALCEVRLMNMIVPRSDFESSTQGPPLGPNLAHFKNVVGLPLDWATHKMPKGDFLANCVGSVHQSYTEDEGATLFILWGGTHANCDPESCAGVSNLLHPDVGHS